MIYTTLDNFYLSEEALENSPSRKHGIDKDTETTLRIYACEMIQEAGILLRFPQAVMATGQVLFHRFYCKQSMKDYDVRKMAATALWLGAKLEEVQEVSSHPEKLLRKVLVVVDRIRSRREGQSLTLLEPGTKDYSVFKEACIRYERDLLRNLGFITHVEHPHKLMLNYCQVMKADKATPELLQEAWSIANDSLRTTLCVRFKAHILACGVIFYAARRLQLPLPENPPWWELFEVRREQMYEVARSMHELYSRPKAVYIPVYRHIAPSKSGPPTPLVMSTKADDDSADRRKGADRPPAAAAAGAASGGATGHAAGSGSRDGAASGGASGARTGGDSGGRADGGHLASTSSQQQNEKTPSTRPAAAPGFASASADSGSQRASPGSPAGAKRKRSESRSPSRPPRPPRAPVDGGPGSAGRGDRAEGSAQKRQRDRADGRDSRDGRESRDGTDGRDSRDGRDGRDGRERSSRDGREHHERDRRGRDDRVSRERERSPHREREQERDRGRQRGGDLQRRGGPYGDEPHHQRGSSRDGGGRGDRGGRDDRGGRQDMGGLHAAGPHAAAHGVPRSANGLDGAARIRHGSAPDLQQLRRDEQGGRDEWRR